MKPGGAPHVRVTEAGGALRMLSLETKTSSAAVKCRS